MASTSGGRAEAERWLGIAEKLLANRDLHGSRTFVIRALESDPRLEGSDRILAVLDTLLAAADRINDYRDWYAVLGLTHRDHDTPAISAQYAHLASLLNPAANSLPFADQAFKLASDAFSVLSDPAKRSVYDRELRNFGGSNHNSRRPAPAPQSPPQSVRKSPRFNKASNAPIPSSAESAESAEPNAPTSFWTACPYCFTLFEYPVVYEECSMRCQNCRRAFQAVSVISPPETGKDSYFCCWGLFPLGFSSQTAQKGNGVPNWSPFSPIFACPSPAGKERPNVPNVVPSVQIPEATRKDKKTKNVNVFAAAADRRMTRGRDLTDGEEEDDVFLGVSDLSEDSDDDDWNNNRGRRKRRGKNAKGKVSGSRNVRGRKGNNQSGAVEDERSGGKTPGVGIGMQECGVSADVSKLDKGKKTVASNSKRHTGKAAWDLGKLDLNVEFSNEVEEPAGPALETSGENGLVGRNGEEDGIEGIGFFEGLDEFFSNLPILKTAE